MQAPAPGKDAKSGSLQVLMGIETKYISSNQSKNPDTAIAAILWSLKSRHIEVTAEDIGSPE